MTDCRTCGNPLLPDEPGRDQCDGCDPNPRQPARPQGVGRSAAGAGGGSRQPPRHLPGGGLDELCQPWPSATSLTGPALCRYRCRPAHY
jgi:hypothetical protein